MLLSTYIVNSRKDDEVFVCLYLWNRAANVVKVLKNDWPDWCQTCVISKTVICNEEGELA